LLTASWLPTALFVVGALLVGLVFGSFLTVVVYRVPRKESLVSPGSRCPACGASICARDNIPVVSWLLLRGRCRSCGAAISKRYPLTELATGLLWVVAAVAFDPWYVALMMALFFTMLLAVSLIDLEHLLIPNRIVYPSFVLFAGLVLVGVLLGDLSWTGALIGCLAYASVLFLIAFLYPKGMGMGDVKLALVIGLVVGSLSGGLVAVAAFAAVVFGALGGLAAAAAKRRGAGGVIPFGPAMAAGAFVASLWGQKVVDWYLNLRF
jgi:leader peptidase (prepilin peptidase)/N-methyltransferase